MVITIILFTKIIFLFLRNDTIFVYVFQRVETQDKFCQGRFGANLELLWSFSAPVGRSVIIDAIIKFDPLPRLPAAPTLLKHIK